MRRAGRVLGPTLATTLVAVGLLAFAQVGSADQNARLEGSGEDNAGPPTPGRSEVESRVEALRQAVETAIEHRPPGSGDFVAPPMRGMRRGMFALGGYRPQAAIIGGIAAPPLRLYPGAGFGNSLSIDPWTGQLY